MTKTVTQEKICISGYKSRQTTYFTRWVLGTNRAPSFHSDCLSLVIFSKLSPRFLNIILKQPLIVNTVKVRVRLNWLILTFYVGCLENSDLLFYMNESLFMIIIVTKPKCQITQQLRLDNWRPAKGVLKFYSKQERRRQRQWQNCSTFACNYTNTRKTWTPRTGATIDVIHIIFHMARFGCLENSDLRPRKLRPRKLRPLAWKMIEILNAEN